MLFAEIMCLVNITLIYKLQSRRSVAGLMGETESQCFCVLSLSSYVCASLCFNGKADDDPDQGE